MNNKITSTYFKALTVALGVSVVCVVGFAIWGNQVSNALYNEQIKSEQLLSEKMQLMKTMTKLNDSLTRQAEKNKRLQHQLQRIKFADRE